MRGPKPHHRTVDPEREQMRQARRFRDLTPEEKIERNPDLLEEAREHVADYMDLPGTPSLDWARFLQAAGLPEWCGTRKVINISITRGDPQHGAKRSDDHIGRFEVEAPLSEFDLDVPDVCECGKDRAVYKYHANHYIAGNERLYCPDCEEIHYSEDWG